MSLLNDAGTSSQRRSDAQLLGLRAEANRCRSFAACVIYDSTRALLEARALEYERQARELEARSGRGQVSTKDEIAEEFA